MSEINIMHQYGQLKSKHTGEIADKASGSKSRQYFEVKTYASEARLKKFEI